MGTAPHRHAPMVAAPRPAVDTLHPAMTRPVAASTVPWRHYDGLGPGWIVMTD